MRAASRISSVNRSGEAVIEEEENRTRPMGRQAVGVKKDSAQRFATYIDDRLVQLIESVPTAMILSDSSGRIVS